jgi:hypothetical protein
VDLLQMRPTNRPNANINLTLIIIYAINYETLSPTPLTERANTYG